RHGCGETVAAYQHVNFGSMLGEKNRGLSRGVSSADECDLFPATHFRFQCGSPVPDAAAFELRQSCNRRTAVARAACDDNRAGSQSTAILKVQRQLAFTF